MKRNLKSILSVIDISKAICLFCVASWFLNMNPKIQQIQFGIPTGLVGTDIDSTIAGWLAMALIPIAYTGYILSRLNRVEPFIILRLQTKHKAFLYRLCCCMVCMLLYVFLLVAPLFASCGHDVVFRAAGLLFLEEVFWMLVYLFFCSFMNMIRAGVCVLMLVTGCCIISKHIPTAEQFVPTTWSMYCRTDSMRAEGTPIAMFTLRLVFSCAVLFCINAWICKLRKGRG